MELERDGESLRSMAHPCGDGVAAGTTTITATSEARLARTTATVSTAVNAVDQILLAPVLTRSKRSAPR
jgi:hypothetical protein